MMWEGPGNTSIGVLLCEGRNVEVFPVIPAPITLLTPSTIYANNAISRPGNSGRPLWSSHSPMGGIVKLKVDVSSFTKLLACGSTCNKVLDSFAAKSHP